MQRLSFLDDRYMVGTEVRIIKADVWHKVNACVLGRSDTVISCTRERNDHLYCVVVYALLDKSKEYGPKVVVKGTPSSFYIRGDEVQHIINNT